MAAGKILYLQNGISYMLPPYKTVCHHGSLPPSPVFSGRFKHVPLAQFSGKPLMPSLSFPPVANYVTPKIVVHACLSTCNLEQLPRTWGHSVHVLLSVSHHFTRHQWFKGPCAAGWIFPPWCWLRDKISKYHSHRGSAFFLLSIMVKWKIKFWRLAC